MVAKTGWRVILLAGMAASIAGAAGLAQSADPVLRPDVAANMARHHDVMMFGVPARYRSYRRRPGDKPAELARGAVVFDHRCASCHGLEGRGDGSRAGMIATAPANLSWLAHLPVNRTDPYMYWTIAEGGGRYGSDMPAFGKVLDRSDIWAVIAYIQFGPSAVPPPAGR